MNFKLKNMKQKGYIRLVLVIFALIIGLLIFPIKFTSSTVKPPCSIGDAPDGSEQILHLPANTTNPPPHGTFTPSMLGPDPDNMVDFKVLRKNVPILKNTLERARGPAPDHTVIVGEIPEKPGYDLHYPIWMVLKIEGGESYPLPEEGIIFFVKKTASTDPVIDDKFIIADIYQDTRFLTGRRYDINSLFDCTVEVVLESPQVIIPEQQVSQTKDQLQLEWFDFGQNKYWRFHCKPAVYLYPERKQLVNVRVFPKGELSYTDPPYDKNLGWTVLAEPDGKLNYESRIMNHGIYDYLYYESRIRDEEIKKPTKGWVVELNHEAGIMNHGKYKDVKQLLDEILPKLGLNEKEEKDFKDYWLSKLPESPYYFVGLVEKEQRDYLETLSVTPKPGTSIRFSLFFEMLDQPISVEEPVIQTPKRNGFTLVDWGGMVKLHPGTPFTCSQ